MIWFWWVYYLFTGQEATKGWRLLSCEGADGNSGTPPPRVAIGKGQNISQSLCPRASWGPKGSHSQHQGHSHPGTAKTRAIYRIWIYHFLFLHTGRGPWFSQGHQLTQQVNGYNNIPGWRMKDMDSLFLLIPYGSLPGTLNGNEIKL